MNLLDDPPAQWKHGSPILGKNWGVMRYTTVVAALLLGTPLAAQSFEAGLFVGQQTYESLGFVAHGPGFGGVVTPENKTVYGVRFGYSVATFGPASFQLTAGFQPESKTTVSSVPNSTWDFSESHWSVGAMFHVKALLDWGAGIEERLEKLSGNQSGRSESATSSRAWVRLNACHTISSPVVKPFIGVEWAFSVAGDSNNDPVTSGPDYLKGLAPKRQLSLYAGVRF
jgi:hypothetical protein